MLSSVFKVAKAQLFCIFYHSLPQTWKMKRKHEEDPGLAIRTKRQNTTASSSSPDSSATGQDSAPTDLPQTRKGFFDLPDELRDSVYALLGGNVPWVHRGRRDPDEIASNSWEIGYSNAPLLKAQLLYHRLTQEYLRYNREHPHVIIHLSMQEEDITSDAPWYNTLPAYTCADVRIARIVVSLAHDLFNPPRFPPIDIQTCMQNVVDAAAANLPNLEELDIKLAYPPLSAYGLDQLLGDVSSGLNVRRLLTIRPTMGRVKTVRMGFLVDTAQRSYPFEGNYYDYLKEHKGKDNVINYDSDEEDYGGNERVRWHATLSKDDPPRSFLGLDWNFVAFLTPQDDGDGLSHRSSPAENDTGPSNCLSDSDSDGSLSLDSEDGQLLNEARQERRTALGGDLAYEDRDNETDGEEGSRRTVPGYEAHARALALESQEARDRINRMAQYMPDFD